MKKNPTIIIITPPYEPHREQHPRPESHDILKTLEPATMPPTFNHVANMWAFAPASDRIALPQQQTHARQRPQQKRPSTASSSSSESTVTAKATAAAAPPVEGGQKKVKRRRWCW